MQIINGDCLIEMKNIPDKSIDMILCDLPYGTTDCKWDVIIQFEPLWKEYKRIIKDRGCIALFGSEPFSSHLRMSNIKDYKYDWIWNKVKPGGIGYAKFQPMRIIENISIFNCGIYYPIMVKRDKIKISKNYSHSEMSQKSLNAQIENNTYTHLYPKNILTFSNANNTGKYHTTQKPVTLLEYLIKTYTLENEIVLDNCMGSGSTGVACINTNRNFIGIEKDETYFQIAKKRIYEAQENFQPALMGDI